MAKQIVSFREDEINREKKAICQGKWEDCPVEDLAEKLLVSACNFNAAKTFPDLQKHAREIRRIVKQLQLRSQKGIILSKSPILRQFIERDRKMLLNQPIRPAVIAEAAKRVSLAPIEKKCREREASMPVKKTGTSFPGQQHG